MQKSLISKSLIGFLAVLFSGSLVQAKESYCKWGKGISENRISMSDGLLGFSPEEATSLHLRTGKLPETSSVGSNEILLPGPFFVIWYDLDLRLPLWTAHHLSHDQVVATPRAGTAEKRADSFRSDPRLAPDDRATCLDYNKQEKVFDQGHMVPNADIDFIDSEAGYSVAMDHSFLMSNMTPQHCAFNRGVWLALENLSRKWISEAEEGWVISGTVFDRDSDEKRDLDQAAWHMNVANGGRVAVPSHQFKIIQRNIAGSVESISFVVPNSDLLVPKEQMLKYLTDHISSIAEITKVTGFDFGADGIIEASDLWANPKFGRLLTANCKPDYPDY